MTELTDPTEASLSPDEAKILTDQIRGRLADALALIIHAYRGRAWHALGYESWDSYLSVEFSGSPLHLPREDRLSALVEMRDSGMSIRAIAGATGLSYGTVQSELVESSADQFRSPDKGEPPQIAAGLDGKTYSTQRSSHEEMWDRRRRVADLADKGHTQMAIAHMLRISQGTVSADLKEMGRLAEQGTPRLADVIDAAAAGLGDVVDFAERATPSKELPRLSAAALRDLKDAALFLRDDVVMHDAWADPANDQPGAVAVILPAVGDLVLILLDTIAAIDLDAYADSATQLRFFEALETAYRKLDHLDKGA